MLTALLGTGAALVVVGLGWILSHFANSAPGKIDDAFLVISLILMLLGGVEMVSVGAGQLVMEALHWAIGWGGNVLLAIISLVAIYLAFRYSFAVIKRHERGKIVWLAFVLPFLLAAVPSGVLHDLYGALQQPASQVTSAISAKLGV